ncbi:abscission/NoCut checkpoint regulator-like isoform X2 [Ruditapes philippinarum]|uniref:abscission/NoCut checkpoint regulator-like isoform X2 n=1 Tax=Ruditapes philippinarum TaxID=129788 RepID=UPI00295B0DFC|nr:abscission/NoCut checkpoint regulator-like isoform X2 [Ruditapes philippinarum]
MISLFSVSFDVSDTMSCYGCGSAFNAFKREHGCKNCGFSFCMKCMPNKYSIPKLNNEKHRVCMKCYNILTGKVKPKDENPAKYSPPENYRKRMAALEEREAGGNKPSHSKQHGSHVVGAHKSQHKNMSKADREIQERLEKLRKDKTPQEIEASKVTAQDLENRLAQVKGMDPSRYSSSNKPVYHAPDRRTQQEQMNDLLDEISSEVVLDSRLPDPVQEISSRLAKLKQPDKPNNVQGDENNLNKPSLRDSQSFSHNISTSGQQTPDKKGVQVTKEEHSPATVDNANKEVSPEDVSRILNEAAKELEQDAQKALRDVQEDKEIMKRLQEIKQKRKESASDINKDENDTVSGSENEEDDILAQSIIHQAIEENKLDEAAARDGHDTSKVSKDTEKTAKKIINTEEEWYDPDELPYCCICTEDATLRCLGCDKDLYCQQCFKEGHKELGLTDHVTLKYTPPVGEGTT